MSKKTRWGVHPDVIAAGEKAATLALAGVVPCRVHPKYQAVRQPTSEHERCSCWNVWHIVNGAREYGEYRERERRKEAHEAVYGMPEWP